MVTCLWGTPTKEQLDAFHALGDANRDGTIDDKDLTLIKLTYSSQQYNPDCDIDGDGKISLRDLAICTNNQGLNVCTYFAHVLTVDSEPQAPFTINGVATATPYTQTLQQGIYTIVMPAAFNSYSFQQWEDGSTDPTRTINLTADTTIKATYTTLPTPPVPPAPTVPTTTPTVEVIPGAPAPAPTVIPPAPEVPPAPITPETAGLIVLGVLVVVTTIGIGVAIWYSRKPP